MTGGEALSAITGSGDDFGQVVALCESPGDYCLTGGLATNAYAEPVYTMDTDFVLASANSRARVAGGAGICDRGVCPLAERAARRKSVANSIHQGPALRRVSVAG